MFPVSLSFYAVSIWHISIIDGNSVAIKSWEKAVLGNVREFESNSNDIFDIIMRELENDK